MFQSFSPTGLILGPRRGLPSAIEVLGHVFSVTSDGGRSLTTDTTAIQHPRGASDPSDAKEMGNRNSEVVGSSAQGEAHEPHLSFSTARLMPTKNTKWYKKNHGGLVEKCKKNEVLEASSNIFVLKPSNSLAIA